MFSAAVRPVFLEKSEHEKLKAPMPKPTRSPAFEAARVSIAKPMKFEEFLAKLPPKDRQNAERRVELLDGDPMPGRGTLWRRMASVLMTLAPVVKIVGKQAVLFFIPDGKYRMQVFALEDLQDGNLTVYCPDVLAEAVTAGVVTRTGDEDEESYTTVASGGPLHIESLDKNTVNPAPHFKDLMGWNRKAIRITMPPSASPQQIEATELLCAVAAQHFVRPAPPADGAPAPTPSHYSR